MADNDYSDGALQNRYGQFDPSTTNYCGESPNPSSGRCSRDHHSFECKHEQRCFCKMTVRLPLEVEDGL